MKCESCAAQYPDCAGCATKLLNQAGFLWNGTEITDSSNPDRSLSRRERNLLRQEINRNQRFPKSFLSLEEVLAKAAVAEKKQEKIDFPSQPITTLSHSPGFIEVQYLEELYAL